MLLIFEQANLLIRLLLVNDTILIYTVYSFHKNPRKQYNFKWSFLMYTIIELVGRCFSFLIRITHAYDFSSDKQYKLFNGVEFIIFTIQESVFFSVGWFSELTEKNECKYLVNIIQLYIISFPHAVKCTRFKVLYDCLLELFVDLNLLKTQYFQKNILYF